MLQIPPEIRIEIEKIGDKQYQEELVKFQEAFEVMKMLNLKEAAGIQQNIDRVKAKLEGRLG